ncbi:YcnI family protein [Microbacterium sp. BWT-B31]|uniref:YcnI family copper-binding membrane protein n=1 Tax=Microbacterium sp. BWT-B31 TaxID=3232072 RepID=UPI00352866E9
MTTHTPARRRARTIALSAVGAAVGIALAVAAPLAASAHVTVTTDSATAGGYGVLTFAFSHGCDGSPTTALKIDIPEGITSVAPTIMPGWQVDIVRDGDQHDGLVRQVTYTAEAPVDSGYRVAFDLSVGYGEETAGQTLAFPVTQVCVAGQTDWAEIAEEGVDPHSLDAPAPVVTVLAPGAEGESGHDGHATGTGQADAAADPLPVALGATGLGLGLAALVVAIVALRRTRSRA